MEFHAGLNELVGLPLTPLRVPLQWMRLHQSIILASSRFHQPRECESTRQNQWKVNLITFFTAIFWLEWMSFSLSRAKARWTFSRKIDIIPQLSLCRENENSIGARTEWTSSNFHDVFLCLCNKLEKKYTTQEMRKMMRKALRRGSMKCLMGKQ